MASHLPLFCSGGMAVPTLFEKHQNSQYRQYFVPGQLLRHLFCAAMYASSSELDCLEWYQNDNHKNHSPEIPVLELASTRTIRMLWAYLIRIL